VISLVLGVATAGAGAWAVFATDNQAGTALLLIVAVVLLLLGLQGTALRSLGGGEYRIELERRRWRAQRAVDLAANEAPEVEAAVVDAVNMIEPRALSIRPPAVRYEQGVRAAVERVGASVERVDWPAFTYRGEKDRGVDIRAALASGTVNIQVKYRPRGPIGLTDVRIATLGFQTSGFDGGFLVVTNAPLSDEVRTHNSEAGEVEVITWNDERDDDLLLRALARNAR
jgi:hypothetical protein